MTLRLLNRKQVLIAVLLLVAMYYFVTKSHYSRVSYPSILKTSVDSVIVIKPIQ